MLILSVGLIGILSCEEREVEPTLDCSNLKTGLINNDQRMVGNEIDKLCVDLEAKVTETDEWGHKENMNTLVDRLNQDCNVEAILLHYATIKTNPPQSEISISVTSNTNTFTRVIDILNDEKSILKFSRMHE